MSTQTRPEERAPGLLIALREIGAKSLATKLASRIGSDDEASLLSVVHQAEAYLELAGRKAQWDTSYINSLPDSAFLYVAPGGSKDSEGKTVPRSLRYFPVRDSSGAVDQAHVRNALSRIPQADVPKPVKDRCIAAAQKLLSSKAWSSAAHPRAAAGTAAGGQFVAASGSSQDRGTVARGAQKLLGRRLSADTIRQFQRAHGIQVDGKIGTQTAAALLGSKNPERLKPGVMTEAQKNALARYALATSTPRLVRASGRKKRFDPNQPRDPHSGEWTSGGGVASSAARTLGSAIDALRPGEQVGEGGAYVKRLPKRDLGGNEYEVGNRYSKTRHRTAAQAHEAAVRVGVRLPGQSRGMSEDELALRLRRRNAERARQGKPPLRMPGKPPGSRDTPGTLEFTSGLF